MLDGWVASLPGIGKGQDDSFPATNQTSDDLCGRI